MVVIKWDNLLWKEKKSQTHIDLHNPETTMDLHLPQAPPEYRRKHSHGVFLSPLTREKNSLQ